MVAEVPDPKLHLEFAQRQLSDPRVWPWHWPEGGHVAPGPRGHEQALEIVERQAAQFTEVGCCLWWWRDRAGGELVGYVGLDRTDLEGAPVVEVGWSISPERWGEGLATEAGGASLDWAFGPAGLDRVVSYTLHDNRASRRVMEKLGLSYVRDFRRRGFDQVLYERLRPDSIAFSEARGPAGSRPARRPGRRGGRPGRAERAEGPERRRSPGVAQGSTAGRARRPPPVDQEPGGPGP